MVEVLTEMVEVFKARALWYARSRAKCPFVSSMSRQAKSDTCPVLMPSELSDFGYCQPDPSWCLWAVCVAVLRGSSL